MVKKGKVDPFGSGKKSKGILRELARASIPPEQKNQGENAPGSAPGRKLGKEIWPNK